MNQTKHVYFYHSKHDSDPLNRGKRVTVCGVLIDNELRFGVARSHTADSKVWSRKFGRMLSEGRADKRPSLVVEKPIDKVKIFFIEKAKELVTASLLTGKENKVLTVDDCRALLNRRRYQLEREQLLLDRKFEDLVATTTKLEEFFSPVEEPVKERSTFSELTNVA